MLFLSQQPYHYERTNVKVIVLCPGLTDTSVFENLPQNVSETDILQNHQKWDRRWSVYEYSYSIFKIKINIKFVSRVESVAHGLVYVIRCAQNGSVWISEDGKPVYEVQLPDVLPQKSEVEPVENQLPAYRKI